MFREPAGLLVVLGCFAAIAQALPTTSLMEDVKKADQAIKPKVKRAQETLMFGNQQNRQAEVTANSYAPSAEKRTTNPSGLDGLKAAFAENEKYAHAKSPSNSLFDREEYSPFGKSYEYGKVLVNEPGEEIPRVWELPPYQRYYMGDDRRKRSEKSVALNRATSTVKPSTTAFPRTTSTQQSGQPQLKRSIPIYPEPRYKRELDVNTQDVLTLLQLWENQRRNRNWRNYGNEEYENIEDEGEAIDDEEPRNSGSWLDAPLYSSHRYAVDALPSSDIGIPRKHPYYDQYGSQYGSQYGQQQYDGPVQFATAQYGALYPQHAYYPQEKRFMMSRKRSQGYDPYSGLAQMQFDSQSRSNPYQYHMVY